MTTQPKPDIDHYASKLATEALDLGSATCTIKLSPSGGKQISAALLLQQIMEVDSYYAENDAAIGVAIEQLRMGILQSMLDFLVEHKSRGLDTLLSKAKVEAYREAYARQGVQP